MEEHKVTEGEAGWVDEVGESAGTEEGSSWLEAGTGLAEGVDERSS